jgi:methylthioribose-1-phosphate isomerase
MPESLYSVFWQDGTVHLLDQRALPHKERWIVCEDVAEVARCIAAMYVRGAPAIGLAAAFGMALAASQCACHETGELLPFLEEAGRMLRATRPTAVNLAWAVDRMQARAQALQALSLDDAVAALVREAQAIFQENEAADRRLSMLGQALLPPKATVLTHCNAGAIATGGYGTALGIVRAAVEQGKEIHVLVDETRPFLQGARLTAWELQRWGIPFTLITDNMAGYWMQRGRVDAVIVGADRIAANGDVANKIGTYSLAVLAFAHRIPFYSAAPTSTLDLTLPDGGRIPIEERDPEEVTHFQGCRVAPDGTAAAHPAFDVTPNRYVTAIVTERGIAQAPYEESLRRLCEEK